MRIRMGYKEQQLKLSSFDFFCVFAVHVLYLSHIWIPLILWCFLFYNMTVVHACIIACFFLFFLFKLFEISLILGIYLRHVKLWYKHEYMDMVLFKFGVIKFRNQFNNWSSSCIAQNSCMYLTSLYFFSISSFDFQIGWPRAIQTINVEMCIRCKPMESSMFL